MTYTPSDIPLRDGFRWVPEPWGPALQCEPLTALARHFFTTLGLRMRGGGQEMEDWARVAATAGVSPDRLWRLKQVHGRDAVVVAAGNQSMPASSGHDARPAADIIATANPDVAIVVQVADCVPLLVADPVSGAVAAAHAGWRGTAANVAATTVGLLAREFGARPEDLVVVHGPSIGPCCYTVGEELRSAFRDAGFGEDLDRWFQEEGEGRLRLDLWQANRDQLLAAGVAREHLHLSELCTFSHPHLFHSYRRDGQSTGRIAAVIRAGRS